MGEQVGSELLPQESQLQRIRDSAMSLPGMQFVLMGTASKFSKAAAQLFEQEARHASTIKQRLIVASAARGDDAAYASLRLPSTGSLAMAADSEGRLQTAPLAVDAALQAAWKPIYDGNPAAHVDLVQRFLERCHPHLFRADPIILDPFTGPQLKKGMPRCFPFGW